MKTAISIPDELFAQAERLAAQTGKSRSRIFQEALAEYLLRRDPESVTEAINRALAGIDQSIDPWLAEVGRRTLERSEW